MLIGAPEAIERIRQGRLVIVMDDEQRENEGDLTCAAEKVTPAIVNFMIREGRGLVCMPMSGERMDALEIPLMVQENSSRFGTAFGVSIEARTGVTTGISAADRARTILTASDPRTRPTDLARPGHVFPLRAQHGGVLSRPGQTEAAVDLARLAGLGPAGVICEILKDDGSAARLTDLEVFSARHQMPILPIADLIAWRLQNDRTIRRAAAPALPTGWGEFRLAAFESEPNAPAHLALALGETGAEPPPLVRVHRECLTGDVFGSTDCGCGEDLSRSLDRIAAEGRGLVLYLRREAAGFRSCQTSDNTEAGLDGVLAAQILWDLGVTAVRLLSSDPDSTAMLAGTGIAVAGRVELAEPAGPSKIQSIEARRRRLGRVLSRR